MTTTIKVTAHCPANVEVHFGIKTDPFQRDLVEETVLQDGESTEKYVWDKRQAVIFEAPKV